MSVSLEHAQRQRKLLEDFTMSILSAAHAFEANKTPTGEDVMAIIDNRPGLVDGGIYANPEFLLGLERYHELVAVAHRTHQAVEASSPTETVLEDSTATVGLDLEDG